MRETRANEGRGRGKATLRFFRKGRTERRDLLPAHNTTRRPFNVAEQRERPLQFRREKERGGEGG